jgi:hypothetical protein
MPASTPIATSKTAALSRVLDGVSRGYTHYISGTTAPDKAIAVANKFHRLYGIGCTPAQRITRKAKGLANALLVLYRPAGAAQVDWLLLATPGTGLIAEREKLLEVTGKPRLRWLEYELTRYGARGVTRWTWRRPKGEMADRYVRLGEHLKRRDIGAVADIVAAIARQPGFHGVREQSWALCQFAWQHGYRAELPFLFYVHKVSHGERLVLEPVG